MVARPMRPPSCRQNLEHIICSTMRSDSFLPKVRDEVVRDPKGPLRYTVPTLCLSGEIFMDSFPAWYLEFDIARLVEGEWSNLWVKKAWKRFFGLTKRCIISASSRGRPGRFVCSLLSSMEFQNFQVPVFWRASWLLNQLSSPRNAPCWEYWPFQSYNAIIYVYNAVYNNKMSMGGFGWQSGNLTFSPPPPKSLPNECNWGSNQAALSSKLVTCARTTLCLRTWAHGHLLRSW